MEFSKENFPALEAEEPKPSSAPPKPTRSRRRRRLPASLAVSPWRAIRLFVLLALLFGAGAPVWRAVTADPGWAFEPEAQAILLGRSDEVIMTWPEYGDRRHVEFDDLPGDMVGAVLAREDQRFFSHWGVDCRGLGRAASVDLKERRIVQGGSTLTMQLVERVYGFPQRNDFEKFQAKLFELLMAPRIEFHATRLHGTRETGKEAILAAYLSRIEYGYGSVGIREAADRYFGKSVEQLSLGECAYLAGLIRGPSVNNAYSSPENARRARDAVIANMEKLGLVEPSRADQVRFYVASQPHGRSRRGDGFLSAAVRRELEQLAADGEIPADYLTAGRLRVHLSADPQIQGSINNLLPRHLQAIESRRSYRGEQGELQGGVIVIDNDTGAILASVGGRDFDRLAYDCVMQAHRTMASAAKPFVYAALFDSKDVRPGDTLTNTPLAEGEAGELAGPHAPRETRALPEGEYPVWKGLAHSSNRMTLRAGAMAGMTEWKRVLRGVGLESGESEESTLAWLGAFEARPVDVAAAYATLPRGGFYTEPYLVRRVEIDGRTVFKRQPDSRRAISTEAANQVTACLREVLSSGTASPYGGARLAEQRPVAGKTGTSDGVGDAWFVGYGSDVTVAVWIGFPDGNRTIIDDETGGSLAFPLWKQVIEHLPDSYRFDPLPSLETLGGTLASRS